MALTIVVGVSALFGMSEAIKQTQSKARRDEHRSRKCHLLVHCSKSTQYSPFLEGRRVVLSGDKLYIDTGTDVDAPFGHPFTGYFLPYPDAKYSGLISSIADDPPIMNWIYVDRDTLEVKFGTRPWAEHNHNGPFDCTRQDRRLTFGGWEGWLAVKEGDFWALYFDRDNDKLASKVEPGTPVLELELWRREIRGAPVKVNVTVPEEAAKGKEAPNGDGNVNEKETAKEPETVNAEETKNEKEAVNRENPFEVEEAVNEEAAVKREISVDADEAVNEEAAAKAKPPVKEKQGEKGKQAVKGRDASRGSSSKGRDASKARDSSRGSDASRGRQPVKKKPAVSGRPAVNGKSAVNGKPTVRKAVANGKPVVNGKQAVNGKKAVNGKATATEEEMKAPEVD